MASARKKKRKPHNKSAKAAAETKPENQQQGDRCQENDFSVLPLSMLTSNEFLRQLSAEEMKILRQAMLFVLAQAYYKILQCVSTAPMGWVDLKLNQSYLGIVGVIRDTLSSPDFKDFPGELGPSPESVFPSSETGTLDWQDNIRPYIEDFLNRAQQYGGIALGTISIKGGFAKQAIDTMKHYLKLAIEEAEEYNAESECRFSALVAHLKSEFRSPNEQQIASEGSAETNLIATTETDEFEEPRCAPMSKTEIARRVLNRSTARGRDVIDLLKRQDLRQATKNKWTICLKGFDENTLKRLLEPS